MLKGSKHSEATKKIIKKGISIYLINGGFSGMKGKHHSVETKRKIRIALTRDIKQNFNSKVKVISNGCWEWQGRINKINGYGYFTVNRNCVRKTHLAHRFSYELHRCKIPENMTIDHLCRNRKCVNPKHLEVVTQKENSLRGNSAFAKNARKTHCLRGHPLFGANLYIPPKRSNNRHCKICAKIRSRERLRVA